MINEESRKRGIAAELLLADLLARGLILGIGLTYT